MLRLFYFSLFVSFISYSQTTSISSYEKQIIDSLVIENNIIYTDIMIIPKYRFKRNIKYRCGEELYDFIDFDSESIYHTIFFINDNKIVAHIYPDYDILNDMKITYFFSNLPNYIDKEYKKSIKINDSTKYISIFGLDWAFWTIREKRLFKTKVNCCKRLKLISSSKYIAKNYGEDFINDVINFNVTTCKPYIHCE